jgi:CrcB protein
MNFSNLFLVFVGGGLGSVFRFFISKATGYFFSFSFPFATFFSNVLAALILALVCFSSLVKNAEHENIRLFLMIGLCGGLSTFSTFSMETAELFRKGEIAWAFANIVFSNLACVGIMLLSFKNVTGN